MTSYSPTGMAIHNIGKIDLTNTKNITKGQWMLHMNKIFELVVNSHKSTSTRYLRGILSSDKRHYWQTITNYLDFGIFVQQTPECFNRLLIRYIIAIEDYINKPNIDLSLSIITNRLYDFVQNYHIN